jgi:regulator of sigma E protease
MNLVLGLVCFVVAYGRGMDEIPAKIGAVMAGSPAYEAGMKAGDEIVAIDGRRDISFTNVTLTVRLSSAGQVVHFDVKRPGRKDPIGMDIEPRREGSAEVPGIGILNSTSLDLADPPYEPPAGVMPPPRDIDKVLKLDDRLIAVGPEGSEPTPVSEVEALHRIEAKSRDKPLVEVYQRREPAPKGGTSAVKEVKVTLPPNHFVDFGFRLTADPIAGVQKGSPAAEAGFRKGDRIVKVDGRDDFDPIRLPDYCYEHAGTPVTFDVERQAGKTVTLTVTPDDSPPWTETPLPNEPLDVPGLGLAYPVRPRISAIAADSPAAKAGLKVGDAISSITIPSLKIPKKSAEPITFDEKGHGWVSAFLRLQFEPRQAVELTVNNSKTSVTIQPEPDPTWYHPLRGTNFQALIRPLPPQGAMTALRRGFDDTVDNILIIYATFRSLAQQRVSPKLLGGPIEIARAAYHSAGNGLTTLIHFLGILSINLAVLNFLPIPPLDGGQMVFLLAEKVRGRPLPDSALIAGTYAGLLFVLGLMAFVIFQDVSRIVLRNF